MVIRGPGASFTPEGPNSTITKSWSEAAGSPVRSCTLVADGVKKRADSGVM